MAVNTANAPSANYADAASVASWARNEVNYVSSIGAMQGTGGDNFTPHGLLAREQAILIVLRFYEAMRA
jgi:hypothetical protein